MERELLLRGHLTHTERNRMMEFAIESWNSVMNLSPLGGRKSLALVGPKEYSLWEAGFKGERWLLLDYACCL